MPDIVKNIYKEIESIQYKQISWENRRQLFSYLNKENEFIYNELTGLSISSFDKELMYLYLNICKDKDNYRIRDCTLLIKSLRFDNREISNKQDIKDTISNFYELEEKLADFQKTCDDPVTSIIIDESCLIFDEIIKNLQHKI